MTLYEINDAILNCIDTETGEIIDEEMLTALEMEHDAKVESIALWIKELKAEAEAIKTEKLNLAHRQSVAENKAKSLENYLATFLDGQKFKTAKCAISYRKSDSVEVDDITKVPAQFLKFAEPTVDKATAKKLLKAGETIDGLHLAEKQNISIK